MSEDGPLLTVLRLIKWWLKRLFRRLHHPSLGPQDQGPRLVGKQPQNPCRNLQLIAPIEKMQKHSNGNDVGHPGTQTHHQASPRKRLIVCYDIIGNVVPGREAIAIPPKLIREVLVSGKEIASIQVRGRSAIEDAFAEILGQAGADVEECGAGF